jgi:hypothetical protein
MTPRHLPVNSAEAVKGRQTTQDGCASSTRRTPVKPAGTYSGPHVPISITGVLV